MSVEQLKIKKASEAAAHERPENAESAWEHSKKTSRYHFRTDVIDPRWDCVIGIGRFVGDWTQELEQAEAEKIRLMPNDEKILENPTEFLKWLDLYDNYTISEQSFISKVGMTTSRAKRLKEEYL